MPVRIKCENGHTVTAPDKLRGKNTRCPECRSIVAVPVSPDPSKQSASEHPDAEPNEAKRKAVDGPDSTPRKKPRPTDFSAPKAKSATSRPTLDDRSPASGADAQEPDHDFESEDDDLFGSFASYDDFEDDEQDDVDGRLRGSALPPRRGQQKKKRAKARARAEAAARERDKPPPANDSSRRRLVLLASAGSVLLIALVVGVVSFLLPDGDSDKSADEQQEPAVAASGNSNATPADPATTAGNSQPQPAVAQPEDSQSAEATPQAAMPPTAGPQTAPQPSPPNSVDMARLMEVTGMTEDQLRTLPGIKIPGESSPNQPSLAAQMHEYSRTAESGVYCRIETKDNGRRQFLAVRDLNPRKPLDPDSVTQFPLPDGAGIPLRQFPQVEREDPAMWKAVDPPAYSREVVVDTRDTERCRITTMNTFGTVTNPFEDVEKRSTGRMDPYGHRHVWSPDGEYLYVLASVGVREKDVTKRPVKEYKILRNRIRKVNARTWVVEKELQSRLPISDITWSSQGLVAAQHRRDLYHPYVDGKRWFNVAYSVRSGGGVAVIDPDTLKVTRMFCLPEATEVAGEYDSDVVCVRSRAALVAVNVRSGELLSHYDTSHYGREWGEGEQPGMHSIHPVLFDNGRRVLTHGQLDWSLNTFRLSDAGIEPDATVVVGKNLEAESWQVADEPKSDPRNSRLRSSTARTSSRPVDTGLDFASVADVAVADEHICFTAHDQFRITTADDPNTVVASISVQTGSLVAADPTNKTLFFCGLDFRESRLTRDEDNRLRLENGRLILRMVNSNNDEEIVLTNDVDPLAKDEETEAILKKMPSLGEKDESRRQGYLNNMEDRFRYYARTRWPVAMSANPTGRGVIVFADHAAYWIEPKSAAAETEWAFLAPAAGATVAAAGDRPKQDGIPQSGDRGAGRGKAATALVVHEAGAGFATAFSLDGKGLFLTSAGVALTARQQNAQELTLVLQAGQLQERTIRARVVRFHRQIGLALLQAVEPISTPALEIGDESELFETAALRVFGFPPSNRQRFEEKRYPGINVVEGTVSSLRRSEGVLQAIQFDGRLLPGTSGAPVLDDHGQVVGIVAAGIVGTDINFLIPVSRIRTLMGPLAEFDPPQTALHSAGNPAVFEATVSSLNENEEPCDAELQLTTAEDKTRSFPMTPSDNGVYRATVPGLEQDIEQPESGIKTLLPWTIIVSRQGTEVSRTEGEMEIVVSGPAIVPPPLTEPVTEIELAAPVTDVVAGGRGRWLVLHLPEENHLAVYDANTAELAGTIQVSDDNVLFAAGMEKLILMLPEAGKVQRWDLATRKLEQSAPVTPKKKFGAIAMGAASAGPVLVNHGRDWSVLDPENLRFSPLPSKEQIRLHSGVQLRAAADGSVFTVRKPRSSMQSVELVSPAAKSGTRPTSTENAYGSCLPNADGTLICSAFGVYDHKLEFDKERVGLRFVPAHHGRFYLCLLAREEQTGKLYRPALDTSRLLDTFESLRKQSDPLLAVLLDSEQPEFLSVAPVSGLVEAAHEDTQGRSKLTIDRRVHLIPDANLIVTIPKENDRLVFHRASYPDR